MDDNNELIIYVLRQLRYGVPEQSIRETLVQNGWPLPLIDRAFSMVQQARLQDMPPSTQTPQSMAGGQGMSLPTAQPSAVLTKQPEMLRPALPEPTKTENDQKPSNIGRRFLFVLMILFAVLAIGAGAYFLYKTTQRESQSPKPASAQTAANKDSQRRKNIRGLASNLSQYYSAHQTYPTIEQINSSNFSSTSKGFAISKFKDPDWNEKASCRNEQGNVTLSPQRSENCYSYRATASNGDDCDANGTRCTRVVLIASLEGGKPFIVALDRNKQE